MAIALHSASSLTHSLTYSLSLSLSLSHSLTLSLSHSLSLSLSQESQLNHIRCSLEVERLRSQCFAAEKQLLETRKEWERLSTELLPHDPDSLQLLGQMFEAELEASGLQGTVDCTTAIHQSLVQGCLEKQRIDLVLREKFADIQAFTKKAVSWLISTTYQMSILTFKK